MESTILDKAYILFGLFLMLPNNTRVFSEVPQIPPFPVVTSQGYIYHVNNTPGIGKDTAAGGTAGNPWLTLKYAVSRISAGDSLFVHGSEFPYNDEWINIVNTGDPNHWITIKGVDSETGVSAVFTHRLSFGNREGGTAKYIYLNNIDFQGGGASGYNIVIYPNCEHLVFDDIEIDGKNDISSERAIMLDNNVKQIWFKDMYIHHCGKARDTNENNDVIPTDCGGICIKAQGIDNIIFYSVKTTNNIGDGISGSSDIRYGNIYLKECISENNTGDGYDLSGLRVVVIDSVAKSNGGHQGVGFKFWSKETWVVNCLAYNNSWEGMSIKPQHSGSNVAYIYNSKMALNNVGKYGGQIDTSPSHPPDGELKLYVHNNVFLALNSSAIVLNNIEIQFIEEESNNYYVLLYDKTLIPQPHWTYRYAIHFRNPELESGYSFAEMSDGERWSIETDMGVGDIGEIWEASKVTYGAE